MSRQGISDSIWDQLQITMKKHGCHRWKNDRSVREAILWKLGGRLGEIFRKDFAHGKQRITVLIVGHSKDYGIIFFDLRGEIDKEWVFTDTSYVRAHQHASGTRRGEERAIGLSYTTKIHIAADAHGNPIDFEITGGGDPRQ